ncbi:unnamed protein product [Penicillium olsonii]|nr:unnamed protein product [Penicillium olsonii]CAG7929309.1 unnamed protein product [Penicillium olsonii]
MNLWRHNHHLRHPTSFYYLSISQMSSSFAECLPYEGYTFVKANPVPGQDASWHRVKRTPMCRSQPDYFNMIQKRATKKSAAVQYQKISSNARRAHINQLIDEQRQMNPMVEWTCVYVKEHAKPSNAPNARRGDYETVSMDVIIMQISMKPICLRASAEGQVDAGAGVRPPLWPQRRAHPLMLGGNANLPRPMIAGPQSPRVVLDDRCENSEVHGESPMRAQPQPQEPKQSTTTTPNPAFSAMGSSDMDSDHTSGSSEDSSSSDDDMLFNSPDEGSETDDSIGPDVEQQAAPPKRPLVHSQSNPFHWGASYGPRSRSCGKPHSRSLDRRLDRRLPAREQYETSTAKSIGPMRSERARSRGSVSGRKYRKQLMSDHEVRSRKLDHREANIGHRERQLKRTLYGPHQLELQPSSDRPAVCRCTCRCAMRGEKVD